MAVYYILLALVVGLAYPLLIKKPSKIKKAVYLALVFAYMFFMCTLRYGIGNDYFSYIKIFENISVTPFKNLFSLGYEPVFALVCKLLTAISLNTTFLYGAFAAFTLLPVAFVIFKHGKNAWLSCYLYICLTFFYTSMNFIRQSVAASIILLSYRFIKERKNVPFLLMALLAAGFHYTALIIIPVYFLLLIKPNKYVYLGYGALTAVVFAFSDKILNLVFSYGPKIYRHYADTFYVTSGLSPVFLIIPILVFVLFAVCFFKTKWGEQNRQAPLFTNLMLYNLIIWLFITKHFILERFSMYVYIFVILAIPEVTEYFNKQNVAYENSVNRPKPTKEEKSKLTDARYGYILLIAAVMIPAFFYNSFGMNDGKNGFHGVFPYKTSLSFVYTQDYKSAERDELISSLKSETDLYKYALKASEIDNCVVAVAIRNECPGLNSPAVKALNKLGFTELDCESFNQNYIGIASNGKAVVQNKSATEKASGEATIDGVDFKAVSDNTAETPQSLISVNTKQEQITSQGLNIVVYDLTDGEVIDSVNFRPYQKICVR